MDPVHDADAYLNRSMGVQRRPSCISQARLRIVSGDGLATKLQDRWGMSMIDDITERSVHFLFHWFGWHWAMSGDGMIWDALLSID
jgi:hypothetical protein